MKVKHLASPKPEKWSMSLTQNFSFWVRPLLMLLLFLSFFTVQATPFITRWKTDNPGPSSDTQISIPGIGTYTVNWAEVGNPGNSGSTSGSGTVTVTFPSAGTYEISIPSGMSRIYFNNGGDRLKLLTIEQWGTIAWTSMKSAFRGCSNLTHNAVDTPDLSSVTDMSSMLRDCSSFNGAIGGWDVSNVTGMSNLFNGASSFNQDLNSWVVSGVTNMNSLFKNATAFNGNISSWTVSSVSNMNSLFNGASSFNQNIASWNVSGVSNMAYMFRYATSFNQNITTWNVASVSNMSFMFYFAGAFDQDLGGWDISSVTTMSSMLDYAGLSVTNYDNTLIGWEAQAVSGISLGADGLNYCNGEAARNALIVNSWSISGDTKDCSTLPVEWASFTGRVENESVILKWETSSEDNSNFFEIERSVDKLSWQSLGRVGAAGYSNELQTYSFTDENPLLSKAYYRLRQLDFDGRYAFSNIIEIYSPFADPSISIYPNPAQDLLTLEWIGKHSANVKFLDLQGRMLMERDFETDHHLLSVAELPAGLYILRINDRHGWRRDIRFVKQ